MVFPLLLSFTSRIVFLLMGNRLPLVLTVLLRILSSTCRIEFLLMGSQLPLVLTVFHMRAIGLMFTLGFSILQRRNIWRLMVYLPRRSSTKKPEVTRLVMPGPRARVHGRMRWSVFEADGKTPALADILNGHGELVARRYKAHGWMPNLITNIGMDTIGLLSDRTALANGGTGSKLRQYAHIGTGSVEPAITDENLNAEVQRATVVGNFTQSGALDTTNNVFRLTSPITVSITLSGSQNLTEYGFGSTNDAQVTIRELFRDELGNPITISLVGGKIITIDHDVLIELPALLTPNTGTVTIEEYDAANTLIGSTAYDVEYGWSATNTLQLFIPWMPGQAGLYNTRACSTTYTFDRSVLPSIQSGFADLTTEGPVPQTYTPGTYERLKLHTLSVSQFNGTFGGLAYGMHYGGGFVMLFDSPSSFTKLSSHTLQHGFKVSWSRTSEGSS